MKKKLINQTLNFKLKYDVKFIHICFIDELLHKHPISILSTVYLTVKKVRGIELANLF